MRRLVIGCGYLGERVARLWRDMGDEVYATTRGARTNALRVAGLRPLTLDVTRPLNEDDLPMVDTVLFAVGRDSHGVATMEDIHVRGLRAVLDALPESTGRVIYVSSTGVYAQDAGEWVNEESLCEPRRQGGRASLAAEQVLLGHPRGYDGVVLRLAGLYGRGRIPRAADINAGRTIVGSPDAYLNLIHVDDAARAAIAAAGHVKHRTYLVSDGSPVPRVEYVRFLARQLGQVAPPFQGGSGLGKRVSNRRTVNDLSLRPLYLTYREGLNA